MSGLESWEDDPAAQDENLSRQAQQSLNFNPNQGTFQPGAASFQPGAATFQPGQQYQYGGGYQQYGQQAYYPQYGQQQQQQQYQQYNNQGYGGQQQGYNQQQAYGGQYGAYAQAPGSYQPQQQRQTPTIAKRPQQSDTPKTGSPAPQASSSSAPPAPAAAPKAKVLSIGGEAAGGAPKAKVLSIGADATAAPKAKVLSIGTPTPSAPKNAPEASAADGAKTAATKAIEKTDKKGAATASSSGKTSPTPASGTSSPSRAEEKKAEEKKIREADAVAKEQLDAADEELLAEVYGKEHVNLIFIGHVDAGKSTLGGSILYATGMVDERTMDKLKREAKEAARETWYLSWALDLTKEERLQGKTVEVGRAFFETDTRRYTILDAPGHKTFVPSMIGGASQADVGILLISARKGEYETGFEKGGQTREHAMLAKTQGVNKLIVAVNKMDDITVEWSKERFEECTVKLLQFLKGVGYNPKTDVKVMPVSAQTSIGIKDRVPTDICPWYGGPSLLEYLDSMTKFERKLNAPFMMPVGGKYKDLGTMIEGRIESGAVKKNSNLIMMPNREEVSIAALYGETEDEIQIASCGDQIRCRLRGIEEEDIMPGYVVCSPKRPVHCVKAFEAQIAILDLKSILTAGFNCVLHVHAAIEEVTFGALLHKLEKGTNRKSKKPPPFASKGQKIIARLEVTSASGYVCVEKFDDYPQLGRFTLRDQGQTIAIGKITKLILDE